MQAGTFGEVWDIGAQVPSPNRLEAAPRLNMGAKNSHVSLSQMVLGVKMGTKLLILSSRSTSWTYLAIYRSTIRNCRCQSRKRVGIVNNCTSNVDIRLFRQYRYFFSTIVFKNCQKICKQIVCDSSMKLRFVSKDFSRRRSGAEIGANIISAKVLL